MTMTVQAQLYCLVQIRYNNNEVSATSQTTINRETDVNKGKPESQQQIYDKALRIKYQMLGISQIEILQIENIKNMTKYHIALQTYCKYIYIISQQEYWNIENIANMRSGWAGAHHWKQ